MKLGEAIITKTPCCGYAVKLTNETGTRTRWSRHCLGGCRKVYDIELHDQKLVWKERRKR